ncbi:ABC transporter permease [Brevibacterium sp. 50QC2O2]|uniref:ABC transporter permease n=1 Tax=Brevibacterium TaxID=1696 RepID=UPI00211C7703|nr:MULTISPECIES: ABC transporter permease [unclassified Brevibacterium]MCQ9368757.1 ABC transporter permease [Brevibacterium sp. 91QC2O2]MCQ9386822.1 ABC transporter permease [Brevibacterium sp. 68QC2CO]MCQ9389739.1 ABC transporter permease [Brevibacterium sp. 50QC2O2]
MISYLLKRFGAAIIIMLFVVFFTLLVFFKLSPDPAASICGQTCTPDRIETIRTQMGLDQPFFAQFFAFLAGIFVGRDYGEGASAIHCGAPCIGYSFQTGQSVLQGIMDRMPVTLTIAIGAAVLWLLTGVAAGVISAVKEGTWWDRGAMAFALAGISLPNYFVALVLQYLLVVQLEWLPFPTAVPFSESPGQWFATYIMPWMVLALMYASMYARLTRTNMIDTMGENFMRTARAKGLKPGPILIRHGLRPSLTPIVTLLGVDFATLLGGALITETVFGLPGIGKFAYDAISVNDQPVIMGVTLVAAFAVVIANIIVDLLYRVLDPRVRVSST